MERGTLGAIWLVLGLGITTRAAEMPFWPEIEPFSEIEDIPILMVNGRYDVICPPIEQELLKAMRRFE